LAPDNNLATENLRDRDDVLNLVYEAIAELQLPKKRRIEPSRDSALFGDGGNLDSLLLSNLIVVTEQKLEERFGLRIDLTQDDPFSPLTGHFRTIGSLATYISSFVAK
jgi:acyl carrier protein